MSASLSQELKKQHNCRSISVRKEDEVRIVRGSFKGKEGKVVQVYRKKWVIHVDKVTRDKVNGTFIESAFVSFSSRVSFVSSSSSLSFLFLLNKTTYIITLTIESIDVIKTNHRRFRASRHRPVKCVITKLKMDKSRKAILARKGRRRPRTPK